MKRLFLLMFFMAFVSVNAYSQSDDSDEIYNIVEEMPEFPGGSSKMMEYIQDNRQYPAEAKELNVHGRVIVKFVIERDGSISNVKVLRGLGSGCDEEAIRLITSMPKWKPGKQRGKEVRTYFTYSITF